MKGFSGGKCVSEWEEGVLRPFVLIRKGHEFKKEMKIKNKHPQQKIDKYCPGGGHPLEKGSFSTHLHEPLLQ